MANWITQNATLCLVALGLVACGMPAAPNSASTTPTSSAATGGAKASAPTADAAAGAAGGTSLTADEGGPGAAHEDAAGRVMNGAGVMTPCMQDFNTRDANGDATITLEEWLLSEQGKTFIQSPEAAFKAKDANKDGKLTPAEYGCDTPTPGATPNGRM